jgi:signal transduction histidine kinase
MDFGHSGPFITDLLPRRPRLSDYPLPLAICGLYARILTVPARPTHSLFSRLLWGANALVLAAILLVASIGIYLQPPEQDSIIIPAFIAITLLILLLVTGVAYLFARYITAPLQALATATRLIARGQLDAPLAVQRGDELGALADDFRAMQKELAASHEALEAEKTRYAELNALKERLLANMPHEIKTPLSALAASLELLQEGGTQMSPEERAQLLESTRRSVLRLEHLVDNMLDAASIQAGQFRIRLEIEPLGPVLQEARAFVQPLLDQKGQTALIHDATGGALVEADPTRILQILVNLLSNANKYGDPNCPIEVEANLQEGSARVQVQNDGDPIPPEVRQGLFQRFSRSPGAEGVSGVGLGLSIARTIVDMHHGEIGLESTAEGRTTAWFSLPLAQVPRSSTALLDGPERGLPEAANEDLDRG